MNNCICLYVFHLFIFFYVWICFHFLRFYFLYLFFFVKGFFFGRLRKRYPDLALELSNFREFLKSDERDFALLKVWELKGNKMRMKMSEWEREWKRKMFRLLYYTLFIYGIWIQFRIGDPNFSKNFEFRESSENASWHIFQFSFFGTIDCAVHIHIHIHTLFSFILITLLIRILSHFCYWFE
jgi:hypothetical protein